MELFAQHFWQAEALGIIECWMNSLMRWRVSASSPVCGRRAETRWRPAVYPSLKSEVKLVLFSIFVTHSAINGNNSKTTCPKIF